MKVKKNIKKFLRLISNIILRKLRLRQKNGFLILKKRVVHLMINSAFLHYLETIFCLQ